MAIGERLTRSSAVVLLGATLLLAAGCAGEGDDSRKEFALEREGARLTLTPDSCVYEGVESL